MDQRLTADELATAHQDLFGTPCAMTQCGECDEFIPVHTATVTTHHITPYITEVEHFCGPECAITNWRKLHGVIDHE